MKQVSWLLISVWAPQCQVRRLPLDEAEQVDQPGNVAHIVDDVLEPPLLDDLLLVDGTDRVIGHQTGLV